MTNEERREIGTYLRARYNTNSQIRVDDEGGVTIRVDQMPNTNQEGWMFAGWDSELLREARDI